jgi:hypothetical protein
VRLRATVAALSALGSTPADAIGRELLAAALWSQRPPGAAQPDVEVVTEAVAAWLALSRREPRTALFASGEIPTLRFAGAVLGAIWDAHPQVPWTLRLDTGGDGRAEPATLGVPYTLEVAGGTAGADQRAARAARLLELMQSQPGIVVATDRKLAATQCMALVDQFPGVRFAALAPPPREFRPAGSASVQLVPGDTPNFITTNVALEWGSFENAGTSAPGGEVRDPASIVEEAQ